MSSGFNHTMPDDSAGQSIICRICGNSEGNKLFTAKERQFGTLEEFGYFECPACGCIQILDFPENIGKYYPSEYYAYDTPVFPTRLTWLTSFLKKSLLKYYMGYFNIPGLILSFIFEHPFPWIRIGEISFDSDILDVGSGSGRKMLSLRRSGFRNLTGVDPFIEEDIIYPEGVTIRKMEIADLQGKYDFIMLHHSFEHMPGPLNVLNHLNRLLAPDGCVLIRIPVAGSPSWHKYGEYWSGLDAPRHLFLHTRESVRILAEKSGFYIDGITCDTTRDAFTTSEKYKRGVPKNAPDTIFSRKELRKFDREAKRLNKLLQGDWACFYLKKKQIKIMNETLILFTDRFPYGKAETFLENEIRYFSGGFGKVILFPLQKGDDNYIRKIPENALLRDPVFGNLKNPVELIVKGLFNTSPLIKFKCEGYRSGVWRSPARLRIWITHFLMIRAVLSHIRKHNLISFFNDADVLLFNWGLRWSQVIPFLPGDIKPRIAVRFHGSDLYEHLNSDYIPWRAEQIKRISTLITVSEAGKKYLTSKYGISPDNIFLSRIGTPDCGLNPFEKTGTVRIVSCSNIVPVKRVDLIVMALKHLKIKADWIHFGEGPLKNSILVLANELPGNISWSLQGEISHDRLIDFYKTVSVDLFLNVSSSEGVPVSVMEALSFGIPVIATDAGGTREIVNDTGGIIIPVDFEPADLADSIETLVSSENYLQLRNAARKTWENKCREESLYPRFIEHLARI